MPQGGHINNHPRKMSYRNITPDEIWILIQNVDNIIDCQRIANYLHENKDSYSPWDMILFQRDLMIMIGLYI